MEVHWHSDAPSLDVPFQHIDSDVLKHMRRGYGEKQIRDLVDQIRGQKNHIWLRTTMLVGHPGESEAAYERLRDFIEEGQIDHLGVFPWSKEDGTASAILPKRVDPERAQERADELMAIQAELRLPRQKAMIGQTLRVMIDGISDESEYLLDGRHEGLAPDIDGKVIICDGSATPGTFTTVRVLQASTHDLVATMDLERELDDEDLVAIDLENRPAPRLGQ